MKNLIVAFVLALFIVGCGGGNGADNASTESSNISADLEQDNDDALTDAPELPAKNWYIRLVVKDHGRALESRSSTLGELEDAEMVLAQKLGRLEPFSGGYIDIAFKDPAGLPNGEYKSHFQEHIEGDTKSWNFTVLCDDSSANVTLKWRGFYVLTPYQDENDQLRYREHISRTNPLLLKMKLVDDATGRSIPVVRSGQIGMMSFNMDGSTSRAFRWELLTEKAVEVSVDKETAAAFSTKQSVSSLSMKSSAPTPKKTIDFSQPPGFKVK